MKKTDTEILEVLKQPFKVRTQNYKSFWASFQKEFMRAENLTMYELKKQIADGQLQRVSIDTSSKYCLLISQKNKKGDLTNCKNIGQDGIFEIRFADKTWHHVQFLADAAKVEGVSPSALMLRRTLNSALSNFVEVQSTCKRGKIILLVLD